MRFVFALCSVIYFKYNSEHNCRGKSSESRMFALLMDFSCRFTKFVFCRLLSGAMPSITNLKGAAPTRIHAGFSAKLKDEVCKCYSIDVELDHNHESKPETKIFQENESW